MDKVLEEYARQWSPGLSSRREEIAAQETNRVYTEHPDLPSIAEVGILKAFRTELEAQWKRNCDQSDWEGQQ